MHISTTWGYLLLILIALVFEVVVKIKPRNYASLAELMKYATRRKVSHTALIMIWIWLGYHFLLGS
jgi:hypothetical protein